MDGIYGEEISPNEVKGVLCPFAKAEIKEEALPRLVWRKCGNSLSLITLMPNEPCVPYDVPYKFE